MMGLTRYKKEETQKAYYRGLHVAIDWIEVRKDYETGAYSLTESSTRHKCKANTITRRAKKEGWERKGPVQAKAAGDDNAQDECSTGVLNDHRKLWRGVKKRLVKGLETRDVKAGLDELKVAKMAGEVLTNVIKGERLAWGFVVNGSDDAEDADDITREMEDATTPPGTDAVVDGE